VIAVGFDFDHTLGIDNKLERVAFLRLLELLITAGGKALGTLEEESRQIDALLAQQRSGAFSIDEAVERYCTARLPHTDARPYVNCYKQYAIGSVDQFVIPMPGTRALLKALRARGIPYAILTNGWSPLQEVKAARVGFDGPVVVSETIGVQKPQAAAFDALIAALGTDRSQVWYVGDTPATDVAGSIACGLKSVWFDAESVPFPENIAKPSAVIHSLDELPAVLETYRGSAALT
jgi:putative hydrolase of the HAD superfamily